MPGSGAAQRVLIVLAAALFAFAVVQGRNAAQRPIAVPVPDDPTLELQLDINSASAADLETLPGVGTALAARIVAHRTAHGPFRTVVDLKLVPGFGEKLVNALRPLVTVR